MAARKMLSPSTHHASSPFDECQNNDGNSCNKWNRIVRGCPPAASPSEYFCVDPRYHE
ncbi:hypothetical protein [Rubritalea tangerina]|uniref:hypothetical protein n=1 Tax=Rubritalea tangerina TaxID=430798 RepID=UPI00360C5364